MIKHNKVLSELLRSVLFKSWMNEEDYQEVLKEVLKSSKTSIQIMSDHIETGIKNGYPLDVQLSLFKTILTT